MNLTELPKEEFAALAKEIYYRDIRPKVIDQHRGEFLVLDVDSGDFEVAKNALTASELLEARHPGGRRFGLRIGFQTAYSFGGMMKLDDAP